MEKKYYVYIYLNPLKPGKYIYNEFEFDYEPFYVGKGTKCRYLKHLTETEETTENVVKFRLINKIFSRGKKPIIIKLLENLDNEIAYEIESKLIKLIGRRKNNSGPLTNLVVDNKPPTKYIEVPKKIRRKIVSLYESGMYLKYIGFELGYNENKIKNILIEEGITPIRKPPTNKKILKKEEINEIISDYNSNLSIRTISKKMSIGFNVIRQILKSNNVTMRGYDYPKTKEHIEKIVKKRLINSANRPPKLKELTNDQLEQLRDLRLIQNKTIVEILRIMRIGQDVYYRNIQKLIQWEEMH